jgi:hypothetical protein
MAWLNILMDGMNGWQWLVTAQGINGLFAVLCLLAAFGAKARVVMVLSALLYVALMFA